MDQTSDSAGAVDRHRRSNMARLLPLLLGAMLLTPGSAIVYNRRECGEVTGDFYQFSARRLNDSQLVSFEEFKGQVVLVANVATYCGNTIPSYTQLNALAEYYVDKNVVILGFPCNQFGLQEPGVGADEIFNGIKYVRPGGGFKPMFTLFRKINVNGDSEDPIYTFLKGGCEYSDTAYLNGIFYSPMAVGDIRWNFEKFLIGKDGKPFTRYHPTVTDTQPLIDDINILLNA